MWITGEMYNIVFNDLTSNEPKLVKSPIKPNGENDVGKTLYV